MTQGELEKIPLELQKNMSKLEMRIMEDIVRKIKLNGFSGAASDWQITRLQQLGMAEEDIKGYIKEALEASDEEIERIFSDEVYEQYYGHNRAYKVNGMEQIPFEDNIILQQTINGIKRQTLDTFENMTGSLGFAIRDPATGNLIYTPTLQYYCETLDAAMMDIHSGAFDYNTVLNRVISQMTNSGLRWIDYDSGWHNRVDVAARRAVMTGFRQIQGKINEQVAAELGTDQYEVTYHVGARPTHQPWQGRVWTMQQLIEVCGLGSVTGLHGANCYHDYRAFPPGSVRTYTDEQLAQMNASENAPKSYNGKQYTTYEALQQQRKMETAMRAQRQKIHLLQEGGADDNEITLAKAKYQGQMQTYKAFSGQMKLPQQMSRVYQNGLNKSKSSIKYNGIPKNWKFSEAAKTFFNVNPDENFKNCVNCSIAYEMRRRGYMIVATDPIFELQNNPFAGWESPEIIDISIYDNPQEYIRNVMALWGNGSRVQIAVTHAGRNGHSFSAEQINNATTFVDAQLQVLYNADEVNRIFSQSETIQICRTDNLNINELGEMACREALK